MVFDQIDLDLWASKGARSNVLVAVPGSQHEGRPPVGADQVD